MDLSNLWQELIKLGPVFALMGVVIYVLYQRNKNLEEKADRLQEDKLSLTKQNLETLAVSNRHMETSNEFQENLPEAIAKVVAEAKREIIDEIRRNGRP